MSNNKLSREERLEKFYSIVSKEKTYTLELAQERVENRYWTRPSSKIAISILMQMKELNIDYSELKEKTGINITTLKLMVKGSYDFKLSELMKLKDVLNIKIKL